MPAFDSNGKALNIKWKKNIPSEYISAFTGSYDYFENCSGAIYLWVPELPTTFPEFWFLKSTDIPKSANLSLIGTNPVRGLNSF